MSGCCHCSSSTNDTEAAVARMSRGRRFANFAGWIVPGAALVLMPKCPMCFAAYVALGTGIALSASTAMYLRWGLIVLCAASLGFLATRCAIRFVSRKTC